MGLGRLATLNPNGCVNGLSDSYKPIFKLHFLLHYTWINRSIRKRNRLLKLKPLTGVSATGKNRKFFKMEQRAIFSSSMANRIPTQFLGPIPNGIKAFGLGLIGLSAFHLSWTYWAILFVSIFSVENVCVCEGLLRQLPIGIEPTGFRIVFFVVM